MENVQTVELSKGNHIFYAQKLITSNNPGNPMNTETYNYQEKFKAILYLCRSNKGRYRTLIQDLK